MSDLFRMNSVAVCISTPKLFAPKVRIQTRFRMSKTYNMEKKESILP